MEPLINPEDLSALASSVTLASAPMQALEEVIPHKRIVAAPVGQKLFEASLYTRKTTENKRYQIAMVTHIA